VVNNGSLSVTLYNHNNTYTEGFNLVGNPYPSPIRWSAPGWTKTNIDNAVYFFRASDTDEYGGTYSSYVNGISSDGFASDTIPSMQGFFVHVTDGVFPVTGTLGVTGSVRINDLTHPFLKFAGAPGLSLKSAETPGRFLVRLSASFTDDMAASADPMVVYFDDDAEASFDTELDALKLFNTDWLVTNFYSVIADGRRLSVNALPPQRDSVLYVPLGFTTYRDGEVRFCIRDIENLPEGVRIFFRDVVTGAGTDMLPSGEYKINLPAGDYKNRFMLAFLKSTTGVKDPKAEAPVFSAYSYGGTLKATVLAIEGTQGRITVWDINGNPQLVLEIHETGRYDLPVNFRPGVYIAEYTSGDLRSTVKLIIGL
jgi:fibronectin-binding autotransporter adhesin